MKKKRLYLFLILSMLNLAVFLFRDSFQYKPYASYTGLYGPCPEACIRSWKGPAARYTRDEQEQGRRILDTMLRKSSQTTVDKATDITSFLYRQFRGQIGLPDTAMQLAPPLEQYRQLRQNPNRELWCGNFGTMFFYFCWVANIPCRAIEIIAGRDHHIVNEFFDEQSGQWVFADSMSGLCAVKNEKGQYLNLVDFTRVVDGARKRNAPLLGLKEMQANSTYYQTSNTFYFFHDFDKEEVYSLTEKLSRYFLPVSWYELYAPESGCNILFYCKLLLFACWLLCLGLLLFHWRKRRNNRQSLSK